MFLNYQLSVNDYLRAAGTASPNKILSVLNVGLWACACAANLLRATHIMPDVSNGTTSASDYGFMSLLSFLVLFLWLHQNFPRFSPTKRWTITRAWKRTVQMQQPIHLSVTEAGVNFQIQGFEHFRQWQHFTRFRESKEMFLLFHSGSLYHIVPKRIFSNLEQLNQFRDLLQENNVVHQKNSKMG